MAGDAGPDDGKKGGVYPCSQVRPYHCRCPIMRTSSVHSLVPAVWDTLLAAMALRHVTPTIPNRSAGRVGDTAMVMLRKWNGHQLSHYFNCGATITGPRADEERIRGVLLAQHMRLAGDTIAVVVHFSGGATPINSGSSGTPAQCTSTGRGESEMLDEVIQRVGGTGKRM